MKKEKDTKREDERGRKTNRMKKKAR